MASDGEKGGDDGFARGWDLFKWNWIAEPPEELVAAVYGILFILFLSIAISGIVALWQLLAPIWIGSSPAPSSAGSDPGAELRGRLLIIGALLTTPFLIWRLIVGHWSTRAAQEQARVAQKQARVAQETARNTLFTKAIEQLGAVREEKSAVTTRDANGAVTSSTEESAIRPNTEVRLGAIYALEKLARDDLEMQLAYHGDALRLYPPECWEAKAATQRCFGDNCEAISTTNTRRKRSARHLRQRN
jgi:ribosomal protein L22